MPGGAARGPRAGAEGEGGRVGALRGGKLLAAETQRSSAHSPGGRCVWEKPLPLRSDLRARGQRGAGDDAPSCGADSVGGPRGGGGIWNRRRAPPAV